MNEMYNMSIVTHNYGVISVLAAIFLNFLMLFGIKNLTKYIRVMSLFTPISSTTIGVVIFTGVVMMASKHLDFTIANIVMIAVVSILIFLEVKRSGGLKYLNKKNSDAFEKYKKYATKILLLELLLVLLVALWMWI